MWKSSTHLAAQAQRARQWVTMGRHVCAHTLTRAQMCTHADTRKSLLAGMGDVMLPFLPELIGQASARTAAPFS